MNDYEKNNLEPKPLKDKLPQNLIIPVLGKLQSIGQRWLRIYIFPLFPEITLLKFGAQWSTLRAAIHVCKLNKIGNRNGKL